MKFSITKAQFDELSEDMQQQYVKKGSKYQLAVEGMPEPDDNSDELDGLVAKNTELMDELKELKREMKRKEQAEHEENENWEELKKSLEEQHAAELADKDKRISQLEGSVEDLTSRTEASKIIQNLALEGSEDIWAPHVQARIKTVFDKSGAPKVVYLDSEGNESKLDAGALEAELREDKRFSRIVRGSNASGAGHQNDPSSGGAGDNKPTVTRSELNQMSHAERATFFNEKGGTVIDDE